MKTGKRILVCPLDWGLGHATRCIPVIHALLDLQCEVLIASAGDALALLKTEFPALTFFPLTGYRPVYSLNSFALAMARQVPKFRRTIATEHTEVESIVREYSVDCIISDNRYGCWSATVPSVIITHQLNIQASLLTGLVRSIHHTALKKFTAVWVPDFPAPHSLAGKLSTANGMPVVYLGPLSRFRKMKATHRYDVLALLSGPEPQRSALEFILRKQLRESGLKTLLVRGKPASLIKDFTAGTTEADHLPSEQLNDVMEGASMIIARSGYSTIMDLAVLGKKAIFIATPGQTEQEYLGTMLMEKQITLAVSQKKFNLTQALEAGKHYTGFLPLATHDLLNSAIQQLLV